MVTARRLGKVADFQRIARVFGCAVSALRSWRVVPGVVTKCEGTGYVFE